MIERHYGDDEQEPLEDPPSGPGELSGNELESSDEEAARRDQQEQLRQEAAERRRKRKLKKKKNKKRKREELESDDSPPDYNSEDEAHGQYSVMKAAVALVKDAQSRPLDLLEQMLKLQQEQLEEAKKKAEAQASAANPKYTVAEIKAIKGI